jgi:serine/threonine protein kinase
MNSENVSNVIKQEKKPEKQKQATNVIPDINKEFVQLKVDYELIEYIGQGSYGMVCRARHKRSGLLVAIKKFTKLYNDDVDTLRVLREISILRQLNHPNIVKLLDIVIPDYNSVNPIYIVLENCDIDLKSAIYGTDARNLRDHQIAKIMLDILSALDYIATKGVLHRDLKPSNVLLNISECQAKLCDFGLARDMSLTYMNNTLWKLFYRLNPEKAEQIQDTLDQGLKDEELITFIRKNLDILSEKLFNSHLNKKTTRRGAFPTIQERMDKLNLENKENNPYLTNAEIIKEHDISQKDNLTLFKANLDILGKENDFKPMNFLDLIEDEKDYVYLYEKLNEQNSFLRKELTWHVSTRWYRAPEIILLEPIYTNAIDIWAVGCIFFELLQKLNGNKLYGPLFPGVACHPLSPTVLKDKTVILAQDDQIIKILSVLGTPNENDLSFITRKDSLAYISKFEFEKCSFSKYIQYANPDAYNLLEKFLTFNPLNRISIEDAIAHPYFYKSREALIRAKCFYARPYYDKKEDIIINHYDSSDFNPDTFELKKLFIQEYKKFKLKV